jgi:hypothetical protein
MYRPGNLEKMQVFFRQHLEEQESKKIDRFIKTNTGANQECRLPDPVNVTIIPDGTKKEEDTQCHQHQAFGDEMNMTEVQRRDPATEIYDHKYSVSTHHGIGQPVSSPKPERSDEETEKDHSHQ